MSKNNSVNYKGWRFTFEIIGSDRVEIVKGEPARSFFPLSSKVPDTLWMPREIRGYMVSRIGEEAFRLPPDKTPYHILFPDTVEYIGKRAFASCQNLRSVILSSRLKEIGNHAFSQCSNLKTVSVSSESANEMNHSILKINECAFWGCRQLTNFDVKTILSVDSHSFWKCELLESIFLSEKVVEIADNAFEDCKTLVICCPDNSYTSEYAAKHNIPFQYYGNTQSQNIKIQITPESQMMPTMENTTRPTDNESRQIVKVPHNRNIKTFYPLSREELLLLDCDRSNTSFQSPENILCVNEKTPIAPDILPQKMPNIESRQVVENLHDSKKIIRTFYPLSQEEWLLLS